MQRECFGKSASQTNERHTAERPVVTILKVLHKKSDAPSPGERRAPLLPQPPAPRMSKRHTKREATMRKSITMRLDPSILSAAKLRAKANNRTLTNYVETLLMRDLADYDENTKVTVFAPEGIPDHYEVVRDPGESDAPYAEGKELIDTIMKAVRPQ